MGRQRYNAKCGRFTFDKAIDKSHELYFQLWQLDNIKDKSKCFFQMIKADEIIGTPISRSLLHYKELVNEFKSNLDNIYAPLRKLLELN